VLTAPGYDDADVVATDQISATFRARSERLGQVVAVTVYASEFDDPVTRSTFHQGLLAASRLPSHPHLVPVLDWGTTEDGRPYVATEFCERGSLADRLLDDGPLSLGATLGLGAALAGAIDVLHRNGLAHQGIRPDTVLVRGDGRPALSGVGLSPFLSRLVAPSDIGPAYTAPEVLRSSPPTPASDVYSAGATLYHALAGRAPYPTDEGSAGILLRISRNELPNLRRADVPALFRALLAKAMSIDPADRFPNGGAMAAALGSLRADIGSATTDTLFAQRLNQAGPRVVPAPAAKPTVSVDVGPPSAGRHAATRVVQDEPEWALEATGERAPVDVPTPVVATALAPTVDESGPTWAAATRPRHHTPDPTPGSEPEVVLLPRRRIRPGWKTVGAVVVLLTVALAAPILIKNSRTRPNTAGSASAPIVAPQTTEPPPSATDTPTPGPPSGSPTATPPPTATTTYASSAPSGQAMPLGDLPGWHQVFTEDFLTNAPLGSFAKLYPNWRVYDDGSSDGSGGQFFASKVASVSGGLLNLHVHTENGVHLGAGMVATLAGGAEALQYGRFTIRLRADAVRGSGLSVMFWPDNDNFPAEGDIEFPSGDLDDPIHGWVQYAQSTNEGESVPTSAALSAWHTETVEWSPGQATFILDGHVVGTVTTKIPETPHDFVIQSQTCNGCGGSVDAGDVQVDWVAVYSRA
jgi:hypothetical protein